MNTVIRSAGRPRSAPLALTLAALLLAACAEPAGPGGADAPISVRANLNQQPIATMTLEVTATDIATPLVFNLQIAAGVASGTVAVPVGRARTFTARAFEAGGLETHRGQATADVRPGVNPALALSLVPLAGGVPVDLTIGSVVVTVTPPSASVAVGQTVQLGAQVTDGQGNALGLPVQWATGNAARATVNQAGLVTAVAAGQVQIVATAAGAAAVVTVDVTAPPPPSGNVIRWINPNNELWSDAASWDLNRVPTITDSVLIDVPGSYLVQLDGDVTVRALIVGPAVASGVELFSAFTVTATDGIAIEAGGRVTLQHDQFLPGAVARFVAPNVVNRGNLELFLAATIWGQVRNEGGTVLLRPGSHLIDGTLVNAGGTVELRGVNENAVTLEVTGQVRNTTGSSVLIMTSTGDGSNVTLRTAGLINQAGTVAVLAGSRGTRRLEGPFTNDATMQVLLSPQQVFTVDARTFVASPLNRGTLSVDQGRMTFVLDPNQGFRNDNELLLSSGGVVAIEGGGILNHGTIAGTGVIDVSTAAAPMWNLGGSNLEPGGALQAAGLGALGVTGDVALGQTASPTVLRIDLAGIDPASAYDGLTATGAATLADVSLEVRLISGFIPAPGDLFTILLAGSVTGAFSTTRLPVLSSGTWQVIYTSATVELHVVP